MTRGRASRGHGLEQPEEHPVCRRARIASAFPPNFWERDYRVDVLILWTNASHRAFDKLFALADQRWQASGHAPQPRHGSGRWDDHDELRYALRSVWTHLPMLGTIYLLTGPSDDVVPTWLKKDTRIRVCPHSAVFPAEYRRSVLPTFSSMTIETMLHRVPGIRSPFLFLNDDFFIGRESTLDDFAARTRHGARQKFYFSNWVLLTTDYMNIRAAQQQRNTSIGQHEAAVIQATWMVEQLLGRPVFGHAPGIPRPLILARPHALSHTPKLLHTGIFKLLWELWRGELSGLVLAPFREWGRPDVMHLGAFLMLACGLAQPVMENRTIVSSFPMAQSFSHRVERLLRGRLEERPSFINLQDPLGGDTKPAANDSAPRDVYRTLLSSLFPKIAPWEIQ